MDDSLLNIINHLNKSNLKITAKIINSELIYRKFSQRIHIINSYCLISGVFCLNFNHFIFTFHIKLNSKM